MLTSVPAAVVVPLKIRYLLLNVTWYTERITRVMEQSVGELIKSVKKTQKTAVSTRLCSHGQGNLQRVVFDKVSVQLLL